MGFHTRHLSKSYILANYEKGGIKAVLQLYRADAIISSDSFSSEITAIMGNYIEHRDHSRLEKELLEKIVSC